ncbi:MAG: DMT family transporter [Gammaproteobacteria bacterium]|nr:DMT family transporter [Gammaproteobacteria bacterium]
MPEPAAASPADRQLSHTLQVLAGAVLISLSAPFAGLVDVSPSTSGFYRMLFGAGGLLLLLLLVPRWREQARRQLLLGWGWSALAALLFALDLWLWHRSIVRVGPGLATLLANFQVFVMTIAGVLLFRERPGLRFFCALLLAMLGLWLLLVPNWPGWNPSQRLGIVLGLLTAMAYSGYMLSLRHGQSAARSLNPVWRLLQISLLTSVLMALVVTLEQAGFSLPDRRNWLLLLAYGLLCQVLGWLLISRGLPHIAAGLAGLLLLLQPALSVTWDMWFFSLRLSSWQWLGLGLCLLGIYLGSLRGFRRR